MLGSNAQERGLPYGYIYTDFENISYAAALQQLGIGTKTPCRDDFPCSLQEPREHYASGSGNTVYGANVMLCTQFNEVRSKICLPTRRSEPLGDVAPVGIQEVLHF